MPKYDTKSAALFCVFRHFFLTSLNFIVPELMKDYRKRLSKDVSEPRPECHSRVV